MAGQTKMIIITSDKDIIRQFTLNKTTNTHIIDLDNNKRVISTETNNTNITDLAFFTGLSELNSDSDQIYKRALDSPDHNRSKQVKVSKKSDSLICTICGDHAIGFNYDVLSCASCKAFFRRNANQHPEKIKCLKGHGQCPVEHGRRRKCARCRLDRCFAMGMRKDFILSEEEKQRRKQRLEENRNMTSQSLSTSESRSSLITAEPLSNIESLSPTFNEIDRLLMDLDKINDNMVLDESTDSNETNDIPMRTLSVEDWMVIQNVRSSFLSVFRSDVTQCTSVDVFDHSSALICWSQIGSQIVLRFINFFRQIDEFESLNADDRFILIKYNIFPLFPISKCLYYNPIHNCFSCAENEESMRHLQFYKLCFEFDGHRESFITLVVSLVETTEQDPILISLLLIILLFSQGLSMSEDEPSLKDPLAVNQAQSYYTRILWSYMINKQGETKTCKQFTQLLREIFRIQSATKRFREFFRVHLTTPNIMDKIAPLMQTVLHIS